MNDQEMPSNTETTFEDEEQYVNIGIISTPNYEKPPTEGVFCINTRFTLPAAVEVYPPHGISLFPSFH